MAVVSLIAFAGRSTAHRHARRELPFHRHSSCRDAIVAQSLLSGQLPAVHGENYLLGTFWPTWFWASARASLPISWGPFIGDYAATSARRERGNHAGFAFLGIFAVADLRAHRRVRRPGLSRIRDAVRNRLPGSRLRCGSRSCS
jgi:hypothetical protein